MKTLITRGLREIQFVQIGIVFAHGAEELIVGIERELTNDGKLQNLTGRGRAQQLRDGLLNVLRIIIIENHFAREGIPIVCTGILRILGIEVVGGEPAAGCTQKSGEQDG